MRNKTFLDLFFNVRISTIIIADSDALNSLYKSEITFNYGKLLRQVFETVVCLEDNGKARCKLKPINKDN